MPEQSEMDNEIFAHRVFSASHLPKGLFFMFALTKWCNRDDDTRIKKERDSIDSLDYPLQFWFILVRYSLSFLLCSYSLLHIPS